MIVHSSRVGAVQRWERCPGGVRLSCEGGLAEIRAVSPHVVQVRLTSQEQFLDHQSWAVVYAADPPKVRIAEAGDVIAIAIGKRRVEVNRRRFACRFVDAGQVVNQDDPERGVTFAQDGSFRCHKVLPPEERYYGFGERTGFLERRGTVMVNWNVDAGFYHAEYRDHLYASIPLCIGAGADYAYGIFLDNTYRSLFDMGKSASDHYVFGADRGELNYYFIFGRHVPQVVQRYTELTGRMPLPPLWALGYHQCRWTYFPERQVRELAREFRERRIPCDCIWLDIEHMDGYRDFTWHPQRFPEPERLLGDLASQEFRLVTIVDPGVKADPAYRVYQEGLAQDFFCRRANGQVFVGQVWPQDSVFVDYTKPQGRRWWGELVGEQLKRGVAGIWNDMNEPALFNFAEPPQALPGEALWDEDGELVLLDTFAEKTLPHDVLFADGGRYSSHAKIHNVFALLMAQATFEGFRTHCPQRRPFILTRAGFAGIQRYAAMWMGDNYSTWDHLALSVPQLLNMGLSGVPFVGVDIGGFAADCSGELLARWTELGAFYPFCRSHAAKGTRQQEPWAFGPEVEAICRKFLALRYRLLPYLYTLFWEAAATGAPVMRPMLWEFGADPNVWRIDDQFMLGPLVLVAPIVRPGQTFRAVYLPRGQWVHYFSRRRHRGGQAVAVEAPLDEIPVFVRSGSVLPCWPPLQHTGEVKGDELILEVYPGPSATCTIYEDAGEGFGYEQGEYALTKVEQNLRATGTVRITPGERTRVRRYQVEIIGQFDLAPQVLVNGQPAQVVLQSGRAQITVPGGEVVELTVR